jgi:steroid 5-alpha reductase family enzyme
MHFVAIVERRPAHRYLYIPALASGGPVPEPDGDVAACAVALAVAVTGLAEADVQVSLCHAAPGTTLLPASGTEVEVRHKGIWRAARHTGWLRQWSGSWWPLVAYPADGAMWTRAVRASCMRSPGARPPQFPLLATPEARTVPHR